MRTVHIGIEEGAEVVDSEGHTIGKVHEVVYNENQELQYLIIQKGLLFKTDVTIPHEAIEKVEDGQICLTVPKGSLSSMLQPERGEVLDANAESAMRRDITK